MKLYKSCMGRLCALLKQKTYTLSAIILLSSYVSAKAQHLENSGAAQVLSVDSIKPLQIGDAIPEALWHLPLQVVNHPGGKDTITLNDHRGKLIILDFWATYCKPCVASLDKIDTLKNNFDPASVAFLPVLVLDSKEKGERLIDKKQWSLPSVVNDTVLLKKAFANYLTGYGNVWIVGNKLFAVPFSLKYIDSRFISAVSSGERVEMVMEPHRSAINPEDALFVDGGSTTGLYYENRPYAVIARYLHGKGTRKISYTSKGDTTILYGWNMPIEELYFGAYEGQVFPLFGVNEAIKWELSDELYDRFFSGRPKYQISGELEQELGRIDWLSKNTYGYNLRYPKRIDKGTALTLMQQDLDKFFGIYLNLESSIEPGPRHKYAVLKLNGGQEAAIAAIAAKGDNAGVNHDSLYNRHYGGDYRQHFLYRVEQLAKEVYPDLTIASLLDSTGIEKEKLKVDFVLPKTVGGNAALLQKELVRYGLALSVEERNVPILVVREKGAGKDKFGTQVVAK